MIISCKLSLRKYSSRKKKDSLVTSHVSINLVIFVLQNFNAYLVIIRIAVSSTGDATEAPVVVMVCDESFKQDRSEMTTRMLRTRECNFENTYQAFTILTKEA